MKLKFYKTIRFQMLLAIIVGTSFLAYIVISMVSDFFLKDKNQALIKTKLSVQNLLQEKQQVTLRGLSLALEFLSKDPTIIDAFAKRDREKLKFILLDNYQRHIKEQYRIGQFQFHLPDATSFLRLHKPQKFGDDLSSFRKTVVQVAKRKEPIKGLEVGRAGLGLRAVYPIFKDGKYLGSVELGASFDDVLESLTKILGVNYAVGIDDAHFRVTKFNNNSDIVKKNSENYFLFSNKYYKNFLSKLQISEKPQTFVENNRHLVAFSVPLIDYSGTKIGSIVIFKDLTSSFTLLNERLNKLILTIGILASIMLVAFIFIFRMRIIKPIEKIGVFTEKLSQGDFSQELKHKFSDEVGLLVHHLNGMKEKLKELFNTVERQSEEAKRAAEEAEKAKQEVENEREYLAEKTEKMLYAMEKFSEGDLTVQLDVENKDDAMNKLFAGFNVAVNKIKELIKHVSEVVEATASAGTQISSSAEEMAAGSSELSGQASEVTAAVEEVTRTIMETTENTKRAVELSRESDEFSKEGVKKINEAKEGMEKIVEATNETSASVKSLTEKTEQIGEITNVINDIADQTNLLALNAAIEAARAGEQGRGFAVVADEVRKLAERTLHATKEIAEMIASIQQETRVAEQSMENAISAVNEGTKKTEEVEEVLEKIMDEAERVENEITNLANASEEELKAVEEISRSMELMNNVTQETSAGIQQIAQATEDLSRLSEDLRNLIQRFKMDASARLDNYGDKYLES